MRERERVVAKLEHYSDIMGTKVSLSESTVTSTART